jgi:pyruvate carboxylase
MYPQVYLDYDRRLAQYDNTSVIPTKAFWYGMQSGDEISVEIEPGKTLIIRYLTTGEARADGLRTVFFELNGQPREVNVPDRSLEATLQKATKADPANANHVAAPMPGKVSNVAATKGQTVKAGERLLSIEAMKMETAVYSPRDAKVADVLVKQGSTVSAQDLLVVLEG